MRLLLLQFWPVWLILAVAITLILLWSKRQAKKGIEEPKIIGLSRSGFLIMMLIFLTIIGGFIWLGSKLEKDTSHHYAPTRIIDGELQRGTVQ